jgi:hypothetical protein
MAVPNYCDQSSLLFAKKRINNPPTVQNKNGLLVSTPYEHHVGSWAFTMVSSVFRGPKWIITAEKIDTNSKKRPDIVVEKLNSTDTESEHYLFMELKAKDGDRFEDALAQVVFEIAETMEDTIEAYVVVQRGTKIAFFEYHNDVDNLDEEGIYHFKGCVSLTQSYDIRGVNTPVLKDIPNDLDYLYHDNSRLKNQTEIRAEAASYNTPCVFDLDKHGQEINFLFHHMANHKPRSSV